MSSPEKTGKAEPFHPPHISYQYANGLVKATLKTTTNVKEFARNSGAVSYWEG